MKRSRSVSLFAYFSKRSKGVETPCTIRITDPNVRKHYHMMYNTAYSTHHAIMLTYIWVWARDYIRSTMPIQLCARR